VLGRLTSTATLVDPKVQLLCEILDAVAADAQF